MSHYACLEALEKRDANFQLEQVFGCRQILPKRCKARVPPKATVSGMCATPSFSAPKVSHSGVTLLGNCLTQSAICLELARRFALGLLANICSTYNRQESIRAQGALLQRLRSSGSCASPAAIKVEKLCPLSPTNPLPHPEAPSPRTSSPVPPLPDALLQPTLLHYAAAYGKDHQLILTGG